MVAKSAGTTGVISTRPGFPFHTTSGIAASGATHAEVTTSTNGRWLEVVAVAAADADSAAARSGSSAAVRRLAVSPAFAG